MIAEWRRRDGQLELSVLGEEVDGFLCDFGVERGFFFETGKKLSHGARVEKSAGKAVLSDLARLFEDVNILLRELRVGVLARCARR